MSLSNLIIESTAPLVLISIGIRMRNSNKIQNRRIQPAHRVDLGALYQCFVFYRFLSPFYLFLTEQCRDRKDLDLDPRIFILHFTGLRLYEIFFSLLSVQYTTTQGWEFSAKKRISAEIDFGLLGFCFWH